MTDDPHEDLVEASVTAYAKANPLLTRSDHEAAIRAVISLIAERTKKARDLNDKAHSALGVTRQQRDAARALLREALPLLWMGDAAIDLRARIAALLGDA